MLSAQERHERFVTAFNRIDKRLRKVTNMSKNAYMPEVIKAYLKQHPGWRDVEAWRAYTGLRNVIEHERYGPYHYLFIPSEEAVRDIERIAEDLDNPTAVGSLFLREVARVRINTPITDVLSLIHNKGYSQFPVYGNSECIGLLTENGITRWISRNWETIDQIDLNSVSAREVLEHEETRENFRFIPIDKLVDDAFHLFKEYPLLEALLITEDGRNSAELLGIITPWDVLQETQANGK